MKRRREFLVALGAAASLALVPGRAWAAEVQVTASLGRAQIPVGQSVYLQVEVSSTAGGAIADPRFPGLEGVDVSPRGSSSGVSVQFDGRTSVRRATKTFTYVLMPRTAGEHEIAVEVEVGGKVHRAATKPKLVATGADFVPDIEHDKAGDQPTSADEEVIVWPVVDKSSVYVGEQIIYELQVWDRGRGQPAIASSPTFKNFWSEDILTPQQQRTGMTQKTIEGVPYRFQLGMRRALFPQKSGTLTIGGPEIEYQKVSGPFFGRSGPPQAYLGRSLAIEVEELPSEGQRADFRPSNVGKFRIAAEVDRNQLVQGEAVRLSVTIHGIGNIALVDMPPLPAIEGLRTYEPKPETPKLDLGKSKLGGSRVFTTLIVADGAGTIEIPALELPYFDPDLEKYEVAKTKPIVLEVEANPDAAPAADAEAPEAARDDDDGDDELLAPVVAGGELDRVTPRERWLSEDRWWLGTLVAPGVLGFAWLAAVLRERFGPDDDQRAAAKEQLRRRTLLTQASAAVDSGEEFYPTLASLLQAAAVGKAGPAGVGLTRARLMALLREQGVAEDEVGALTELLDACDAARFGAGSGDPEQRRDHLERARALLGKRGWRAK